MYSHRYNAHADRHLEGFTARLVMSLSNCRYVTHSVVDLSWYQEFDRMCVATPLHDLTDSVTIVSC